MAAQSAPPPTTTPSGQSAAGPGPGAQTGPSTPPPGQKPLATGPSQMGNPSIFEKAPPGVEEALRERMALFYQCQVDGAFRKGEQYVAEDSKDRYYNSRHQKYFTYKIVQIKFNQDFTEAEAMVVADVDLHFQGRVIRAPMPVNAHWKLENGIWCWFVYIPKAGEVVDTPFGKVVTPDPKNTPPLNPGDKTEIGKKLDMNTGEALKRFGRSPTLSKTIALLTPDGKYSDEVVFENTTKVPFKFHIRQGLPTGFTVSPMSGELKPREAVILKVNYKPPDSSVPPPMFKPCGISYGDEDLNMTFYLQVKDK
jgi:hypothetical protein